MSDHDKTTSSPTPVDKREVVYHVCICDASPTVVVVAI
ncbi:hypothetical protein FPSE_05531 [Fusarium pseudograminearum CS3096]|uniref:Uncharacterized protein n=1 Tax=Fusarium pseudograminearum (strain CS3096) TaxID=1028729 RepID=K3VIT3_FUSPC|nr:hypothetical protein FPSE_05531 [Fusarium pseudograminearum CS3096]EKJ74234.1 hypothetical protein FPSE_05531 [Fusarium pseudograminearum CS3096]